MKRKLGVLLICLFVTLGLTACAKPPSQGKPGGEAPIVISIWYTLDGKEEKALQGQLEQIDTQRPEVIINALYVPASRLLQKVVNTQAGGEGPEMIISDRLLIQALYEKGAIADVLAEDKAFAAAKAAFTSNQQPFAAAWLVDIPLLYYRKDKVLEPPTTLIEMIEKKNPIALKTVSTTLLSPWWTAEGGKLSNAGIPTLDAPTNRVFVEKLLALQTAKGLDIREQAVETFINGEVDYLLAWSSDKLKLTAMEVDWGCIALPSMLGAESKVWVSRAIGIANSSIKTTPAVENAIRLVEEELLKLEVGLAMEKAGGFVPARKDAYTGEQVELFKAQVAITLEKGLTIEGYTLDWKLLGIQDQAWERIFQGAPIESELEQAQHSAMATLP